MVDVTVFWEIWLSEEFLLKKSVENTDYQCSYLDLCGFIRVNLIETPNLIRRIKSNYCTKVAYIKCARFRVHQSLGADAVPPLMFPDQIDWAQQIIEEYGRDFRA